MLVRGLRTHLYSDALSAAIYYVLGLHMGDPIRQNEMGDLIDHVYATSEKTMDDPTAKSSKVRNKLAYYSDLSDIVALMCLRPARSGGALGRRLGAAGAIAVCAEGVVRVSGRPVVPVDTLGGWAYSLPILSVCRLPAPPRALTRRAC